jgi:hypothetical protein
MTGLVFVVVLPVILGAGATFGAAGAANSSFPLGARRTRVETRGLIGDAARVAVVGAGMISRSDEELICGASESIECVERWRETPTFESRDQGLSGLYNTSRSTRAPIHF